MSRSIETLVRDHIGASYSAQEPLTAEEIQLRIDHRAVPRRSNRRGLWVAVAAVVITILAIGVIPLLVRTEEAPPADTIVPTTTVTTVLPELLPSTGFTSANPAAVAYVDAISETAEFLGGLEVPGDDDIPVFQLGIGPEPQFNPSELGIEMALEPWNPGEDLQSKWGAWSRDFLTGNESSGEFIGQHVLNGPILYVGEVAGFDQDLIVFDTDREFCGGQCWGISEYGYKSGTGDGEVLRVVVFVPLETSVVAVTSWKGERIWQRPIGGWSMFYLDDVAVKDPPLTYFAYDVFGDQIGHWDG